MQKQYEQFLENGYCLLRQACDAPNLERITSELSASLRNAHAANLISRGELYGSRDLLRVCPEIIKLIQISVLREFACLALSNECGIVRGLYFDKPPSRSWSLPWHRDQSIAVKMRPSAHQLTQGGYENPTLKSGIQHVIAPHHVLTRMLTFRIHLDPMTAANGPLHVIPGSHLDLPGPAAPDLVDLQRTSEEIHCDAGDVFVMHPLLVHSSSVSSPETQLHRRIVHLELAASPKLPADVQWRDYHRIFGNSP